MIGPRSFHIAAAFCFALGLHAAAPATAQPSNQSQPISTMETMYVAAAHDDVGMFHKVAAPEFYAFDGGKRFSGDELMALIKALHAAGNLYVWRVTEPEVHVYGDTALITYINKGSVQDSPGTEPVTWLESAVLRKATGTWRIGFFHSSRLP